MSWFKTAVICLFIIFGFVVHSYMDRYEYFHQGYYSTTNYSDNVKFRRWDKWTGKVQVYKPAELWPWVTETGVGYH